VVVAADGIAVVGGCSCVDTEVGVAAFGELVESAPVAVPDYMIWERVVSAGAAGLAVQAVEQVVVVGVVRRSVAAWEMGPRLWVREAELRWLFVSQMLVTTFLLSPLPPSALQERP
jgi:hypothetical protein